MKALFKFIGQNYDKGVNGYKWGKQVNLEIFAKDVNEARKKAEKILENFDLPHWAFKNFTVIEIEEVENNECI